MTRTFSRDSCLCGGEKPELAITHDDGTEIWWCRFFAELFIVEGTAPKLLYPTEAAEKRIWEMKSQIGC